QEAISNNRCFCGEVRSKCLEHFHYLGCLGYRSFCDDGVHDLVSLCVRFDDLLSHALRRMSTPQQNYFNEETPAAIDARSSSDISLTETLREPECSTSSLSLYFFGRSFPAIHLRASTRSLERWMFSPFNLYAR